MPAREFVVDTCVLVISQDAADARALDALALLHAIKSSHRLALDHDRRILTEYFRHAPGSSHAGQWLKAILSRADRVCFYPACLAHRHVQALQALRFDRSDLPFVATSADSVDSILVSEDSDYNEVVVKYLADELAISVLGIRRSLEKQGEG